MPKIFVTRRPPESAVVLLHEAFGAENVFIYPEDRPIPREVLLEGVRGVDAILSMLTEAMNAEVFDAAGPQLRIVANMAVGYNNIDVSAATERGIAVSNTPDVLTETTADLTFALILATARRLCESEHFLRSGQWASWSPTFMLGMDVYGKTLGIYGLGRIGKAVVRRAKAFNMKVLYHSRTQLPAAEEVGLGLTYVDFPTLLAESDIVSPHCPLTDETRHVFNAATFKAMKKSAIFVNTTRGPVVDETALAAALHDGEIFAAGLDVYEEEPKIHPDLLTVSNIVLLPHIGSSTLETRSAMANLAAENIIALLKGNTPPTCVNPGVL
ncbi:MAG: D-glycerate dehydrogenase [Candidatus Hydrogenedentes bacterium]|nr:D-glycerate dehydrogenase [Candidatus Hydrogenedentota bacterium]